MSITKLLHNPFFNSRIKLPKDKAKRALIIGLFNENGIKISLSRDDIKWFNYLVITDGIAKFYYSDAKYKIHTGPIIKLDDLKAGRIIKSKNVRVVVKTTKAIEIAKEGDLGVTKCGMIVYLTPAQMRVGLVLHPGKNKLFSLGDKYHIRHDEELTKFKNKLILEND